MSDLALIALGANLGKPQQTLAWARGRIAELGEITAVSALYRTAPVGGPPGQPDYLNAALGLQTEREPMDLLAELLRIEREAGRERRERWGPRVLDLDLLAYGSRVSDLPGLSLPHPRLMERAFVLAPLADIAPDWLHPVTGVAVRDALTRTEISGVERLTEDW
jgi:2-amino-4-hydroxy-6-hydroxymethyldihydropteridine diphosphokinase